MMKVFSRIGLIATLVFVMVFSFAVTGLAQRKGAWVDEVIIIEEPEPAAAVSRLEVGEIDVYAYTVTLPDIFQRVLANPKLAHQMSFGSYGELSFNPAGPVFPGTGKLNPFAIPRIREAMNYLLDREYLAEEIFGGMAVPKLLPITGSFPDYARYADVCRVLELKYAHDPVKADAIISEEMVKLGAERVGGKWYYNDEPVEIIVLIRSEDERREVGDYVGNILEDIGFTSICDYRTAAEATPIWYSGNPDDGLFHIYTGGWITTAVARDQATNFSYFYTDLGLATPLWLAYENDPEFYEISERLMNRDFKTMEERGELFAKGLELALLDSTRVWTVDEISFAPHLAEVSVTADLAGSISGSWLWPHTIRRGEQVGGSIHMAMPSILTEPWNPLGGSNWIYDMALCRPTSDRGAILDPYTGLTHAQRLEKAEIYIQEGLPVGKVLDWVDLHFVKENKVPADAWIDWDPATQRPITVGEKHPEGLTALRKSVAYYPADFFENAKWHDGSPMDVADFVIGYILDFERAYEDGMIYDAAVVPSFNSSMPFFKGFRIASTDPLIIEGYSDIYVLDAELNVITGFPDYDFGPGSWHGLGLGILVEHNNQAAFSADKSTKAKIEWLNYIGGPCLDLLNTQLDKAIAENWIPYEPTLSQFVSKEQAAARWANMKKWYNDKGHFWVGMGPLYLDKAYHTEKVVHLKRFEDYPFDSGKWDIFAEPMIPEVEIVGRRVIQIGKEAKFDLDITFAGEAYEVDMIDTVTFMIFDARGQLAHVGEAVAIADGHWQAILTEEQTSKLVVGASSFEVAAVSKVVSIPAFANAEFVTYR